ncbi:beta strand repeat-containing protein [Acetobacter orleanensis]|uniref:Uncharacterized protein n=1 Tax=Acetobacter orleanensis TaxID=104099 RepID=A0A4Y3TNF9_9PROT|nr:calcium-binding protein [Acetobacter orleanensis]KXV62343.1 hypothetical protein AD949_11320 [Acetobacter orleanensis]PCD79437.1 hypothetical protein CO710_07290 [Acetobacter orleanensis]GAN67573.1 outer membrane protein [Acetobacter orleanensis JCM 7639]GBR25426.1 hypothetical protein AA0473_0892 [Acetobacter orleanensis NRIC 0473]GEB82567.1 hypothetical protein AOR01nite_10440 [Acetobacter orleanensis]
MAIITVAGASGGTVQVTVDGAMNTAFVGRTQALANQLSGQIDDGKLDARYLDKGSNSKASSSSNQSGYGVITAGGSYQVSGDFRWLTVGANSATTAPSTALDAWVNIDASKVTTDYLSVIAGTAQGVGFHAGAQSGLFVGGSGDNLFQGDYLDAAPGAWDIRTGDGNDTINGGNGNDTIYAGAGNNTITLGTGVNYVHSDGQDTITATSGVQSITLNGGNSFVNVGENSLVVDAAGNEQITVGGASTVTGGSNDYINMAGATGTVEGGQRNTISAAHGNLTTAHTDSANINVSGALTFIGGTGDTTITAGQATIFGSNNLYARVNATSADSLFVANDGNETLDGASSAFGIHAFGNVVGTTGSQLFIGGSASDTLVGGVGNATLTGGSGAANVFGFRDGIAGADYTITDFGSAAGNSVLLVDYDYTASQFQQNVLDKAAHNGNNTTITLSDNSQITFVDYSSLNTNQFSGLK